MSEQDPNLIERSETVKEEFGTRSFLALVPGVVVVVVGVLMAIVYPSILSPLGWILLLGGIGAVGYGIWQMLEARKVKEFHLVCPFCQANNVYTQKPTVDVRCVECSRMVPIQSGDILRVFQVQCGYCRHLNYYTEKSTGLICEQCDSVIPIATDEGPEAMATFEKFTRQEDPNPYDLVLLESEHKTEKLIACLQRILALNRNQVKQILDEAPAVLLSGIPRKKAELLVKDIEQAGGHAEYRATEQAGT